MKLIVQFTSFPRMYEKFAPGLRDTGHVRGNEPATILAYFENPGRWMVHCHISEHAEKGMMADILVGEEGDRKSVV